MSKSEPSTIGGLLSAALARELSEDEMRQNNDDETELVATLLLSSVKTCTTARCAFEVRSAHGSPLRLQARGDADLTRWTSAITKAIADQLTRTPKAAKKVATPHPVMTKTPSSKSPFPAADRVYVASTLTEARRVIAFIFFARDERPAIHAAAAAARRVAHWNKGGRPVTKGRRRRSVINDLL